LSNITEFVIKIKKFDPGIRDMDGSDPTMKEERVNHLTEVAERFTGESWRTDEVR